MWLWLVWLVWESFMVVNDVHADGRDDRNVRLILRKLLPCVPAIQLQL